MIRGEGIVAALEIRKDRTPTVLRKLSKAEADTRVARRCAAAPVSDPATPRAAPSLPSRSLNSSAPENPTNTGFNS